MTALQKQSNQALTAYGTRDDVREMVARLRTMTPGGNRMSDGELAALAQGAIAHGLDPLNGEVWIIPNRGLMIGVKGLRKKAREQVKGNFWIDFREITNAEERTRYGIPQGALAFEARLFDSENILTYTNIAEKMLKAGIPWASVEGMIGTKPYTSGIGVLKAGENTKMERVQCAMKRAEADALKRRFDVPFGMAIETEFDEAAPAGDEWIVEHSDNEREKPDPAMVAAVWGDEDEPQVKPAPKPERKSRNPPAFAEPPANMHPSITPALRGRWDYIVSEAKAKGIDMNFEIGGDDADTLAIRANAIKAAIAATK